MRRRKKMRRSVLSCVLAVALVVAEGAFYPETVYAAENTGKSSACLASVTLEGMDWKLYSDYTVIGDGIVYKLLENDTAEVTGYDMIADSTSTIDVVIPATIPLTCQVYDEIVGESATIDPTASATVSENPSRTTTQGTSEVVRIGTQAFQLYGILGKIEIPYTVTSIGEKAFFACSQLKEITFSGTNLTEIKAQAFGYCSSLEEASLPNGIETIGELAFENCDSLVKLYIPDTAVSIGSEGETAGILNMESGSSACVIHCNTGSAAETYAKKYGYSVSILSGEMPSSAPQETEAPVNTETPAPQETEVPVNTETPVPQETEVPVNTETPAPQETEAPVNTETPVPQETEVPVNTETPKQTETIVKNDITYQVNQKTKTVSVSNMKDTKSASVRIPATVTVNGEKYPVTKIEKNAFSGNKKIKKVEIGKNVTKIGVGAFKGCTKLSTVKFSEGVKKLGKKSFYNCTSLKNVSLPDSVQSIGIAAFKNCKSMKTFTVGNRSKIKKGTLSSAGQKVRYGAATVKLNISASALENCTSLKSILINSMVRKIGNSAFKNCKSLRDIFVHSKVLEKVAKQALKGVSNCKISVPDKKLKPYSVLFKNKGQGKKVIVAKL